ncbi:MAG: gamma-glutamyltransferase [Planctomycetota bacterium]|nr:MAG: gamma-glutamyltransferase [Planctomycetota bacterium]
MYATFRTPTTALALAMSALLSVATAQQPPPSPQDRNLAGGYDRPSGDAKQTRSVVMARNGMVASSHPAATQAGLDILRAGGNAADAAVAVNAMLGVVEPMSCGVGGDLFVIYWDAKTKKLYGLNGSGRSPYKLAIDEFRRLDLKQIPTTGPLSWSVPGCVRGWEDLLGRFGRRKLADVLAPAISAADDGFVVAEIIGSYWKGAEKPLSEWPDSAATYLVDGKAPAVGTIARLPRLAATYRQIARGGAKEFYEGSIAERIVRFSEANGGFFTAADFADHKSEWIDPVSTNYRGYDVWELPPNGQGIAALQILNLLEPYDLRKFGYGSADYIHLFTEAKKLAFADRARFYHDPAFGKPPVEELISKKYAEARGKSIDMTKAATDVPAGDPKLAHGDTVYITVVDKDRNCCSLIQSLYEGFGSKVAPGDVGFVLQNRGCLFALDDKHPNKYEPHKRPFHTIIPAMVTKDGRPWLSFGVMGGDMQPQGHVQIVVNLVDFGMNLQQAGDAARVRHLGSATPTGEPMESAGGTVAVESGIFDATLDELRRRGHQVRREKGSFGGYQAVLIDWEHGVLQGASDPRKDGCALGY